jgi:hypothetical protein
VLYDAWLGLYVNGVDGGFVQGVNSRGSAMNDHKIFYLVVLTSLLATSRLVAMEPSPNSARVEFGFRDAIECVDVTPIGVKDKRIILMTFPVTVRLLGSKDALKEIDIVFSSPRKDLREKTMKVLSISPAKKGIIEHDGNIVMAEEITDVVVGQLRVTSRSSAPPDTR